jgi:hypothetical protein
MWKTQVVARGEFGGIPCQTPNRDLAGLAIPQPGNIVMWLRSRSMKISRRKRIFS